MRVGNIIISILLACVVASCFTGVENTGRITDKDVSRVKANRITAEEEILDTVSLQSFNQWKQGKRFFITNNDISLVLKPSADSLKGSVLSFIGIETLRRIDNSEEVVLLFESHNETYRYETGKSLIELTETRPDYIVPFVVDMDYVEKVNNILRGRTLWIKTRQWEDINGSPQTYQKYVAVKIDEVRPGDSVYPLYVAFSHDDKHSGVFMSSALSPGKNATFDKLFSLTDIRKHYKHISDETWDIIINGKVAVGMTKEECTLSLGSPRNISRQPTYAGMLERWSYDNGVFLTFQDGILENYRL